ncbi:Hypothetical protein SRAE_2000329800 [Strongyloides ratti]|uniref:Uncharacterized protein n=1 Tax=Strongyloides ratti TaxID=34506 RepID=A0A090LKG8_STRRB|nr:Hypothetical protein SRAE_2000329800 [Strongyloides ratti]CEF68643.1 Hypothetical protein SRAE_2000329800 [Strongyloides ratti]
MGKIVKADKKKWSDVEVDGNLLKDPEFANLVSVEESCDEPTSKKSKKDNGNNDIKKGSGTQKNKGDEYFDDYVNEEVAQQNSNGHEAEKKNGSGNNVEDKEENKNKTNKETDAENEDVSDEELEDEELEGEECDRELDEEIEGEEAFDEEADDEVEAEEEETEE